VLLVTYSAPSSILEPGRDDVASGVRMQLTDQQLNDYIRDVLFFGPEDKQKYQNQIDNLKTTLTNSIHDNSGLGVSKINQAGSWRKGTALRPFGTQDIDIDLVVYLNVEEAKRSDITGLHALIVKLLRKAYPTKQAEDFTPSKKAVGIEFRTSGLLVDLVPVVPIPNSVGYVWQPEVGGGGTFRTSPEGQLEFIRSYKDADPRFTQVVRLAKRWRNYAELDALSSFTIELIAAHLNRTRGTPATIEMGLHRFLMYVAQFGLKELITFPGAIGRTPVESTSVRIYDPTNNENNVTARMQENERVEVVNAAMQAVQAVNHAMSVERKGDTVPLWQRVLGPQFAL